MMHPKALTTPLIWLAALALAPQTMGAPAFLDACQCQACECGQQTQQKSCCEGHHTQSTPASCGRSCCQTSTRDCTPAASSLGSCCCVESAPSVPASLPKGNKASPEKPLPQVAIAPQSAAAPSANPSVILLTDVRHESPPPRILYCVWRN